MRIGVVGSHGVGKTILVNTISEKLQIPKISEQIRESLLQFAQLGFRTPDDMVGSHWYTDMVFDVFRRQIGQETLLGDSFISDRTTMDYFAYYELLGGDVQPLVSILKSLYIEHYSSTYDLVIYVPIRFKTISDDYRNIDEEFRHLADMKIREYLENNANVYILHEVSIERRIVEMSDAINRFQATSTVKYKYK